MNWLLFSLSLYMSLNDYNINPPLASSHGSEVGFWSMVGATTNMKNSVQINSKVNKTNGAICHRLPTSASDWTADIDYKLSNGTFNFSFTLDPCPFLPDVRASENRNGFIISLTAKENKAEVTSFIIDEEDGSSFNKMCRVDLEGILRISVHDNYFNVSSNGNSCGNSLKFGYSPYGFFMLSSVPGEKLGDVNIRNMNVTLPKNHEEEYDVEMIDKLSRNYIRKLEESEIISKVPYSLALLASKATKDSPMFNVEVSNVLAELELALKRTISKDDLKSLIESRFRFKLARIERKIAKRRNTLIEIHYEMRNIRLYVDNSVVSLRNSMFVSLNSLSNSSVETLKTFLDKIDEGNDILNKTETAGQATKSPVSVFLMLTCILELVLYLTFFFDRHKHTSGFKKHD